MTSDSRPYRPCVGVMLLSREGRVFVGNRIDRGADDAWQMPQGGVDPGEDLLAAARRELHEETNVTSVELLDTHPNWLSYDIPPELAAGRFVSKWRGQTQKWFAFRFTGTDSEIDIIRPAGGAEKPEFDAWRWVDIDDLPRLIVAFKRPIYEAVVARFRSFARPT